MINDKFCFIWGFISLTAGIMCAATGSPFFAGLNFICSALNFAIAFDVI